MTTIDDLIDWSSVSPVYATEKNFSCEICGQGFEELVGTKPDELNQVWVAYEENTGEEVFFHSRCVNK